MTFLPSHCAAAREFFMAHHIYCASSVNSAPCGRPLSFYFADVQLTQRLLGASHPALALQLNQLFWPYTEAQAGHHDSAPETLSYYSITDKLGAAVIVQIIAALTTLGEQKLEQSQPGTPLIKHILNQWINLGDWLVGTATTH
jgi:hypothetical protein